MPKTKSVTHAKHRYSPDAPSTKDPLAIFSNDIANRMVDEKSCLQLSATVVQLMTIIDLEYPEFSNTRTKVVTENRWVSISRDHGFSAAHTVAYEIYAGFNGPYTHLLVHSVAHILDAIESGERIPADTLRIATIYMKMDGSPLRIDRYCSGITHCGEEIGFTVPHVQLVEINNKGQVVVLQQIIGN